MSSSNWAVVVDPRAAQDLKKLRRQHHPILSQLIRAIDSLVEQPYAEFRGQGLDGLSLELTNRHRPAAVRFADLGWRGMSEGLQIYFIIDKL